MAYGINFHTLLIVFLLAPNALGTEVNLFFEREKKDIQSLLSGESKALRESFLKDQVPLEKDEMETKEFQKTLDENMPTSRIARVASKALRGLETSKHERAHKEGMTSAEQLLFETRKTVRAIDPNTLKEFLESKITLGAFRQQTLKRLSELEQKNKADLKENTDEVKRACTRAMISSDKYGLFIFGPSLDEHLKRTRLSVSSVDTLESALALYRPSSDKPWHRLSRTPRMVKYVDWSSRDAQLLFENCRELSSRGIEFLAEYPSLSELLEKSKDKIGLFNNACITSLSAFKNNLEKSGQKKSSDELSSVLSDCQRTYDQLCSDFESDGSRHVLTVYGEDCSVDEVVESEQLTDLDELSLITSDQSEKLHGQLKACKAAQKFGFKRTELGLPKKAGKALARAKCALKRLVVGKEKKSPNQ